MIFFVQFNSINSFKNHLVLWPVGQVLILARQQVKHDRLGGRNHDDGSVLAAADEPTLHRQKDGGRQRRLRRQRLLLQLKKIHFKFERDRSDGSSGRVLDFQSQVLRTNLFGRQAFSSWFSLKKLQHSLKVIRQCHVLSSALQTSSW